MSDAFAQINALLAAAAAQQQSQQNQNQQPGQSTSMIETHRQQQLLLQQFSQFAGNIQQPQIPPNLQAFPPNMPPPNMPPLNELQAFLYTQSLQQKSNQQRNPTMNTLNNNNSNNINNMFQNQSILKDISSNDTIDNNSFFPYNDFQNNNNQYNNSQSHRFQQSHQQSQQQYQNEPPTRVLEPYFSDDSPYDSLEHQVKMANMHREHQSDLMSDFQKISLNEAHHNNTNKSQSHHNTSSNLDNQSMFSLNDSEIYSSDQNYMPGTASLIEDVDKQIMVVLRDGRTLIGYLRSIDQYANLLLSSTFERIHVGNKYGDIPKGIYIIRGENVVLIGEVDFKLPCKVEMTKVEVKEILELQRIEQEKEKQDKSDKKALQERCALMSNDPVLDEYY